MQEGRMTTIRELYIKKLIDELNTKQTGDIEKDHVIADKFMYDLLRKLGYSELVDFIESQERWYA